MSYIDLGKLETRHGRIIANGASVGTYRGFEGSLKTWELTVGRRF